jgi:hypothetical protein
MAGVSSQGTYFAFAGSNYTVTSVTVNGGAERQRVSAPHMGLGPNDTEPFYYLHRSVDSLQTVDVDYIGQTIPSVGASATLTVSGRIAITGTATCVSSQVTASVGDIVRGTASFRVQV